MNNKQIYISNTKLKLDYKKVRGEYVFIENEYYYKISNYDYMDLFFMSIVSNSDIWMYIWSNGALSAGRQNADNALFPYYTDDKIRDSAEITGSKTIIFKEENRKRILWEPFSDNYKGVYSVDRNCYKNIYGNKLIFEEINHDLQISFQYTWLNSEKYGLIKKSTLINHKNKSISVNILDGIQNVLPYGLKQEFQNEYSTLADAYKKNELEEDTKLGIFALSSIPVDRAEPSEALKSNSVWHIGINPDTILISSLQLDDFRQGLEVEQETLVKASRGAYFIQSRNEISPNNNLTWYVVADVGKDSSDIVLLKKMLKEENDLIKNIENDIAVGTENLVKIVANADGLQISADRLNTSRHFSNVLFNIMRGGSFKDNYIIKSEDFCNFVSSLNKSLYQEYSDFLLNLPEEIEYKILLKNIVEQNDNDLERVFYEYLPLTFSRRHGDPSRPWNKFSIDIKGEYGEEILNYQGNWRDIFQNWEALALSFPEFLQSMISRFVNASTVDGYNPYRINREGSDWEILDPNDPWSYIGYWGDHQIIYLLKLLELSQKYFPGKLLTLLQKKIFTYTNVPYRIKSYNDILTDPFNTIDFDEGLQSEIEDRVNQIGSDGKLVWDKKGNIYLVNLIEKLLLPILVKFSNFIPEAGIWINTQRPEWNDANNALVGNGVSMVTLYYLRRHLAFCQNLFKSMDNKKVNISKEVQEFFDSISQILEDNKQLLNQSISDQDRKTVIDLLGNAGSKYRNNIYANGFTSTKSLISFKKLDQFCEITLEWIDHSIRANQRNDKLYHAYNLIGKISNDEIAIRYLYEMLEGQVAILSSGLLTPKEALEVLVALRGSSLYRKDQFTYILYPNRHLAKFTEKNIIPRKSIDKSKLLQTLVKQKNHDIIIRDIEGGYHFNGNIRNATMLIDLLQELKTDLLRPMVEKELEYILDIFEESFNHKSFTGRSGTFFKYEGLGSIYWHMVSKLLLAVQENYYRAKQGQADQSIIKQLKDYYYEIKEGIGAHKTPDLYGGFPTDPYSHTPAHAGVQQPGMTGQVKEDILSRFGELGVIIHDGKISFQPVLLPMEEFLKQSEIYSYFDIKGNSKNIYLDSRSLAFTIAQVPIIYHLSDTEKIVISKVGDKTESIAGLTIDEKTSSFIFNRNGKILQIDVFLNSSKYTNIE